MLTFSKPMNPVAASNLNNYVVHWSSMHGRFDNLGPIDLLLPWGSSKTLSFSSGLVRLRSVQYDPATQSVTLIPKRKLTYYPASISITVTQGHAAKTSGWPGHQLNVGQGLTELEGTPINAYTTPGKFKILVGSLVRPTP